VTHVAPPSALTAITAAVGSPSPRSRCSRGSSAGRWPRVQQCHRGGDPSGALAHPPKLPNAVAHTAAQFNLYSAGVLGVGTDDAVYAGHDELVETLALWNGGMQTLNFMAGVAHTDPADVRQAFTEDTYQRLVALKSRYDPRNMFRFNHNVPPLDPGNR
jgi:hypothetical protein